MKKPSSPSNMLHSYRKRRQLQGPVLIYGAAGLLVMVGLILLVLWLIGPNKPFSSMFATETPTPTITPSPTNTSTPTLTPTETATPTLTVTATPSAPFSYTVQEGEYLQVIVEKFSLGNDGIPLILMLNPYSVEGADNSIDPATQIVYPGQAITLPNPGMPLPTATPIPPNLPRGTKLDYVVQAGDTLAVIATKFNSTIEDIMTENELEDANAIFAGQTLVIPVNMVTATASRPPSSTPATPSTPVPSATATP
jgi:LysM repeat protein